MTNHTKKYLDYLESPAWQTKRQEVFAVRGYNCEACRSSQVLQVHHKTYARLGREYAQDMAVLCRDCHEEVHRLARRGSLAVATDNFIARKGGKLPPISSPFSNSPRKTKRAKQARKRMDEVRMIQQKENERAKIKATWKSL